VALKFYMDVHIPATITAGLRRRNIDALTSQEDGTREVDDVSLLQRATELGRVLFSQDQDLLQIASEWQRTEHSFLGLVFSAQQGVSIGQCVEDLELLAQCYMEEEIANQVIFLPLR
jgi:predicted nuclease of predicted toxin-antitoxin system